MMKRRGNSCHEIGSLRELRNLRHANEMAKEAVAGRVRSGVAEAFSLSCLFVTLVRHYAPDNIKHIMQMICKFSKP